MCVCVCVCDCVAIPICTHRFNSRKQLRIGYIRSLLLLRHRLELTSTLFLVRWTLRRHLVDQCLPEVLFCLEDRTPKCRTAPKYTLKRMRTPHTHTHTIHRNARKNAVHNLFAIANSPTQLRFCPSRLSRKSSFRSTPGGVCVCVCVRVRVCVCARTCVCVKQQFDEQQHDHVMLFLWC